MPRQKYWEGKFKPAYQIFQNKVKIEMANVTKNQVVVYHDETKDVPGQNFKGHVLFFVPVQLSFKSSTPLFGEWENNYSPQKLLFEKITEVCKKYSCDGKLHFSQISGKTWKKYDYAYLKSIELAVDALRHKSPEIFPYPLNCKIAIIFYPKGTNWKIYGDNSRKEQKFQYDETLLRILLKGAVHYLYNEDNLIEVINIISDGNPAHRPMNENRILWRLNSDESYGKTALRDYVSIAPNASIIHLPSNHNQYTPETDQYMHARFLQIADLLLGSMMRACYVGISSSKSSPKIGEECIKRDVISQSIKDMLDKQKRGSGFKNSSHYKSFSITQVNFRKEEVNFKKVHSAQIIDLESLQMQFNFAND